MKYEEIVAKVKKAYAKADTALVDEHLAVQVDVTGEGEGAFYIEVSDGKINVEPWEYLDHDFKISCSAEEIISIAEGSKKLGAEVEAGNVYVSRNVDKVSVFDLIVAKKSTAGRKKAEETAAEPKKATRKTAKKDDAAKKEVKEKKVTKKTEKKEEAAPVAEVKEKKKPGRKPKKTEEATADVKAAEAPKAEEVVKEKKKPGRKPKNAAEVKA